MKAISITLSNDAALRRAVSEVMATYASEKAGTTEVVIRNVGTKSVKQRGLQHIWYQDIVRSGKGGQYEADEHTLDIYLKYRWGLKIMLPTRPLLAEAYVEYSNTHKHQPDRMMWWVEQNVHTEQMTVNEMAQFLTAIFDWYVIRHGFNLTDPDEYGWKGLLDIADEEAA